MKQQKMQASFSSNQPVALYVDQASSMALQINCLKMETDDLSWNTNKIDVNVASKLPLH